MRFQIFKKSKNIFNFLFVFLISYFLFLISASQIKAEGVSLYLFPSSGNYKVGSSFTISVKVNTGGVAINAAEGTIFFDTKALEVVNLSKSDSIFTLWVQEPTFSNFTGTIKFGGGLPHPGFTGSAGTIFSITFRSKAAGLSSVNFFSGAVLASDGMGTNILATMKGGNYNFQTAIIIPPTEEKRYLLPPTPRLPTAPVISSLTHPDPEKWYSNNDPEFTWKLPPDVTNVSYTIDQNPTTDPEFVAKALIDKVNFTNLKDGIWYFHINFKNQFGWGKLTHRKISIDVTPPEPFEIIINNESDPTNPTPYILFATEDLVSGVEYYQINIGGEITKITPQEIKKNPYRPPPLSPGKHSVEVKAFDKAGNYTSAFTEIEILPIETPIITKYPKRINIGEKAILKGKSLPQITILVFLREKGKELKEEKTKADEKGNWAFTSKPLEKGEYEIWVQARDKRGALSLPSKKISFWVGPPLFLKFGKLTIDYGCIMFTLIVLIAVALSIIFYSGYRVSLWRKRISKETKEVTQNVTAAFKTLRKKIKEQISLFDKKPSLSKEEKLFRDKLQEVLDVSEQFIDTPRDKPQSSRIGDSERGQRW